MDAYTVLTFDASGNRRTPHDYNDLAEACAAAEDDSEGSHTSCVVGKETGILRVYINGEAKLISTTPRPAPNLPQPPDRRMK